MYQLKAQYGRARTDVNFESSDFGEHFSSAVCRAFLLRYMLRVVVKGAEKVDDWR